MKNQTDRLIEEANWKHKCFLIEVLKEPENTGLKRLENSYLNEIGEETLDDEQWERLAQAIRGKRITFFLARCDGQAIGMCSVSRCFSTFACADMGVFEDFYIEPVFRKKGIARMLAETACEWCRENGIRSLTVCCAPCDEEMYKALGFCVRLGGTYAQII